MIDTYNVIESNVFDDNSIFSSIYDALQQLELQFLLKSIKPLLQKKTIILCHPLIKLEKTYCRGSFMYGMANVLVFSNANNNNAWALLQIRNFVDAIVVHDKVIRFPHSMVKGRIIKLVNSISSKIINYSKLKEFPVLDGFLVDRTAPYHYFYDNLMNVNDILRQIGTEELCFYYTKNQFVSLRDFLPNTVSVKLFNSKQLTLSTNLIRAEVLIEIKTDIFYSRAKNMENRILHISPLITQEKDYDYILWLGVTGAKRRWVEQIDGYVQICKKLAEKKKNLLVLIDGMTAADDSFIESPKDMEVYNAIKSRLVDFVSIKSTIGLDYKTKVGICKNVDAFIVNAGTGCLVPHRFCNKVGVLHGGTKLIAFPNDSLKGVKRIEKDHIKDIFEGDMVNFKRAEYWSYSIDWKCMVNAID
jgi:hypothetical protein